MSFTMKFHDFLERVEGLYKSIDLRVFAARGDGDHLNAMLTVVRFSFEEVSEVIDRQKELGSKWLNIDNEDFTIKMVAYPFDKLDNYVCLGLNNESMLLPLLFLNEDGKVKDALIIKLRQRVDLLSMTGEFTGRSIFTRTLDRWPYFEAFAGEHSPLIDDTELQSIVKSQTHYDIYTIIQELLEIDFSASTSFDFLVTAPFYAAIDNVDFHEQTCKIGIKFHENISGLAYNAVLRTGSSSTALVRHKANSTLNVDEAEDLGQHIKLWRAEADMPNVGRGDHLHVTLMQTQPTALDIDYNHDRVERFIDSKSKASQPLLAAFRRFCTEDSLQSYLTNPGEEQPPPPKKPSSAFEGFVSWLLTLCGLPCIWLGWTGHETLVEGRVQHLRLDILAYYDLDDTLLLIQCTMGSPDDDIDKLNSIRRKLYDEVFADTNIQIKGFIFSPQPSVEVAKQRGADAGVTIFGANDIRGIISYIRRGDVAIALNEYFDFTYRP